MRECERTDLQVGTEAERAEYLVFVSLFVDGLDPGSLAARCCSTAFTGTLQLSLPEMSEPHALLVQEAFFHSLDLQGEKTRVTSTEGQASSHKPEVWMAT